MEQPILVLKDINKSFYGVQVLFDVNLELYKGEVLGSGRRERRGQIHADERAGRSAAMRQRFDDDRRGTV